MKPHYLVIAMSIALLQGCETMATYPASSQAAVGVHYSGVNIGVHYSSYPELVQIPGHPVYYDPRANSNYFFYNSLFWVLQGNNWYSSGGYNGPWNRVDGYDVPSFVLRIPVRYYRQPPSYFRGWIVDAPPRWGDHWGREWEQRRNGWDRNTPRDNEIPKYAQPRMQQEQQRQQDQQRQREQQRQQDQQRQQEQQRQQDQQRQQEQQRQQDHQRQREQQRQQDQQRQQEQQGQQDQQRQRDQQRQQGQQGQQRHQEQQQNQLGKEPSDRNNRQDERDKWKKKKEEERDQGR